MEGEEYMMGEVSMIAKESSEWSYPLKSRKYDVAEKYMMREVSMVLKIAIR